TRAIYLDEHQAALGRMRKEAPPLGAGHKAWELRATDRLSDAQARRKYKEAAKFWQQLAKDQPNTVWEALARDALKVPLGAGWVSVPWPPRPRSARRSLSASARRRRGGTAGRRSRCAGW